MYQKYNLGCGVHYLEGFINMNAGWNVLLSKIPWIKKPLFRLKLISEGLLTNVDRRVKFGRIPKELKKIRGSSADRIYSKELIEHLTPDDALLMLEECFRILCPGSLIRIGAPDGALLGKRYIEKTMACIREGEDTCEFRDLMFNDIALGYLNGYKNSHRSLWDIPSMRYTLAKIGFEDITVCSAKIGKDPTMMRLENDYKPNIFYMEAVKPL